MFGGKIGVDQAAQAIDLGGVDAAQTAQVLGVATAPEKAPSTSPKKAGCASEPLNLSAAMRRWKRPASIQPTRNPGASVLVNTGA